LSIQILQQIDSEVNINSLKYWKLPASSELFTSSLKARLNRQTGSRQHHSTVFV
jgi:hypothetical protein